MGGSFSNESKIDYWQMTQWQRSKNTIGDRYHCFTIDKNFFNIKKVDLRETCPKVKSFNNFNSNVNAVVDAFEYDLIRL